MKRLESGVTAYDAVTASRFNLKAHLVLITGDSPGVAKLLHLSGHGAKYPCRACEIEGEALKIPYKVKDRNDVEQVRHITKYYFPPRKTVTLRTAESYRRDGDASLLDKNNARLCGIKGISPFTELRTVSVPNCSPFDIMHLVYLGLGRDLCDLLSGTYFKAADLNRGGISMGKSDWAAMGKDMANIETPASWGRSFREISQTKR